MNTWRWVTPIECPLLREPPVLAVPPFGCRDDALVMFADPARILAVWPRAPENNAPVFAQRIDGLAAYRATRALLRSRDEPASMPVLNVSAVTGGHGLWITRADAALLAVASDGGCTRLPIVVTGDHRAIYRIRNIIAPWSPESRLREQCAYDRWIEKLSPTAVVGKDQGLTQKILMADLAAHIDGLADSRAGVSRMRGDDVRWIDRSRAAIDRMVCTGVHAITLECLADPVRIYRSLTNRGAADRPLVAGPQTDVMDLLDRFDAGHQRWIARHAESRRQSMSQQDFQQSVQPLGDMVTRLGRFILANPRARERSAGLLEGGAQAALDHLAANPPPAGIVESWTLWPNRASAKAQRGLGL